MVEIEDENGDHMEVEISSVGGSGTISPDSPLGRALVGRSKGDAVDVDAPSGSWTARILSITRSG
jgi:transcription elongation GreA/GreB family factor